MIIYGTKATHVASEILSDTCSNCGTQGSIQMTIFQKYAHVFWIPFFPVGKTGATQCTHCKHVLERKEFPASLYGHYETMKINSRTPRWTFTGLSVITVIIVWGIVSKIENDQKNAVLILTPEAGDIYHIKKAYKQYTLYKVDHVAGDTVFVFVNQFETDKLTGLTLLLSKGDEAFIQEHLPIMKSHLKAMFDRGDIIDIDRRKKQPASE